MRWVYLAAAAALCGALVADVWFDFDYEFGANVAVIAVAALTSAFAVLYAVRSKWWRNRIGTTYLVTSVFLAAMLAQIATTVWWGADFPGRQHIRFALYVAAAVAYVPMIVTLWREQRRDRRALRADITPPSSETPM